ncbi:MAG: SCO family protein [Flavobacteriaceae bacterium]|nr:SCO family protein [Flavobacteriaceae bacterium]
MNLRFLVCFILTFVSGCNSATIDLPILSYKIDASGQKTFYNIDYDDFTNQLGDPFEMAKHKIYLSNFFFTRCPSICPPMQTELISIAQEFLDEENITLVSHTIDPKHDTISVLKTYAEAIGIPAKKWQFIRASEEKTKLQAKMYMTNFKPYADGSDFYHSSFVTLVDQKQQIRGFYNVLLREEVERLKKDIRSLLP